MIAIRKDHRCDNSDLKRGDLFEIILIQTKGGSATRPTQDDLIRLSKVAQKYNAKAVILSEWQRGTQSQLSKLNGIDWEPVSADKIFG